MVAPGNIIVLDGPSSSGKSTLARHCQDLLEQPLLHLSSDQLVDGGALPHRRDETGPSAWAGRLRPLFFDGFHRCIPAMASAGNNLVDHITEYRSWRLRLEDLLGGFDVFLVAVHDDGAELGRRERLRGDRRPGEGAAHLEDNEIHQLGSYDFEIDTTAGVDAALARSVVAARAARRRACGLPQACRSAVGKPTVLREGVRLPAGTSRRRRR